MSVGNRAATCTSCGKRLNRKQWYYRNGKYFCKKRCWVTESEKAAQDAEKAKGSEKAAGKTEKTEGAKAASAASSASGQ